MENAAKLGEVITFYSYKGGTGRSMALANVGCALAQTLVAEKSPRNVLLIDWDLEAPGLHHFLPPSDGEAGGGVLEFFHAVDARAGDVRTREDALALFGELGFEQYVRATAVPGLSLLPAGRFDSTYGARVNAFSWEDLFNKAPALLPAFAEFLAGRYAFVLVDSRTGITDVSGLCTTILPSKLVVVFTPNKQSLTGIFELVRRATKYRRESNDWRPLSVFPLPSRIEPAREQMMNDWRFGNSEREGYQRQFESLFRQVYALDECDLTDYLNEVQIQHVADYAYGEQVAVLVETATRLSLKRSFEEFASRLRTVENAWQDMSVIRLEREIAGAVGEASGAISRRAFTDAWSMLRGSVMVYLTNSKLTVPELADVLSRTASGLLEEGKTKEALELRQAAVAAAMREDGEDAPETVQRLLELAQTSLQAGLHQDALATAERIIGSSAKNAPATSEALRIVAEVRARMGDLEGSLDAHRRAVEVVVERFGARSEEVAHLLLEQVPRYLTAERFHEAEELLTRARTIYEEAGNLARIPVVLRHSAAVRIALGDVETAEAMLDEALRIQKEIGADPADVSDTLEQLALAAAQRGNLEKARRLLEDAYFRRSTSRDRSDPAVIKTLGQIGRIAARMGQYDVARERIDAAIALAGSSLPQQHALHVTLRQTLAEILADQGAIDGAQDVARQALKLASAAGDLPEMAVTLFALGVSMDRHGRDAVPFYTQAFQMAERLGQVHMQAIVAEALGRHLARHREDVKAKEWLHRGWELFERSGQPQQAEKIRRRLAALDDRPA